MWLTMSAMSIFHARSMMPGERLLHVCIGASIAAHALLILLYVPGFEPPLPPTPIKATLRAAPALPLPEVRTPEAMPPPPAPAAAAKPPPPVLKPLLESTPPKSASAPVAETGAVAAPAVAVPVLSSVTAPVTAPVVAPSETKSNAPVADWKDTPRAPAVTTQSSVELSESQLIQAYAAQVVGMIETRRLARMPREAIENGWQGNTIVLIRIGADGNIAEVSIAKSSGYEVLDATARTGASRAKQFVAVPAALRGKAFDIRGDITFKIVEK